MCEYQQFEVNNLNTTYRPVDNEDIKSVPNREGGKKANIKLLLNIEPWKVYLGDTLRHIIARQEEIVQLPDSPQNRSFQEFLARIAKNLGNEILYDSERTIRVEDSLYFDPYASILINYIFDDAGY